MDPDPIPEELRRVIRQEVRRALAYARAAEMESRRWLRVEEVAVMLQVSTRQIDKWIAAGKLSFRKAGSLRRISPGALARDLDALFSKR